MNQKGFSNLVIIAIVGGIIVVSALGYFLIIQKPATPAPTQLMATPEPTPPAKTSPAPTPTATKLPKIILTRFSPTAAGGSGIGITPTSFVNNISQKPLPESGDVHGYKTLFSSSYVADLAKTFGVPLATTKPCPSELGCGNENIENGVYKTRTMDGETKYYLAYNYDEKTGKYPVYRELGMASGGDSNFVFEVKSDSPLYSLPEIINPNQAIQQAKKWLTQYPKIFEDLDNWGGKYEQRGTVNFAPTQPQPLYRAPYIRVSSMSSKKSRATVSLPSSNSVSITGKVISTDSNTQTLQVYAIASYQEGTLGLISRGPTGLNPVIIKVTPSATLTRYGEPIVFNQIKQDDIFDILGTAESVNSVVATSITAEKEVVAVITWLSSHNKQISTYKLRSVEDAWKDLSSSVYRGYYDQLVILGVPISAVNSDYITKHSGAIAGTFTANDVSLSNGRWDDPYYASPGFFLAPAYEFSGLLDIGVQKLPLKIWVPAVPHDKG